ncbi:MAG: hypothetical protein GY765_24290, partial [bacterium]|nr:hypothetical protein [bacterium]
MKRFFLFLLVCFVLAFNLPAESTDPAPDSTPDPAAVRLQYAQTMKDLKFLGDFIVGYVMDNGKAPG